MFSFASFLLSIDAIPKEVTITFLLIKAISALLVSPNRKSFRRRASTTMSSDSAAAEEEPPQGSWAPLIVVVLLVLLRWLCYGNSDIPVRARRFYKMQVCILRTDSLARKDARKSGLTMYSCSCDFGVGRQAFTMEDPKLLDAIIGW